MAGETLGQAHAHAAEKGVADGAGREVDVGHLGRALLPEPSN